MEPTDKNEILVEVKTTSKKSLLIGVGIGLTAAIAAFVLKERLLDHVVETVENSHSSVAA